MALITELIDGYADMTTEEKLAAIEKLEQPEDTDGKKWKAQYDKTAHELAGIKKTNKELQEKLDAKLTDDERAQAEREKAYNDIIAERDALKKESAISKTAAKYIALGYTPELAQSTAEALYDNDIEKVIENANSYKADLEQNIRAEIVKGNPVPKGKGSVPSPMTKKEIMAIKDTAKRRQAIQEHIELFQ